MFGYCKNMIWILNSSKLNNEKRLSLYNTQILINGTLNQLDFILVYSTVSIKGSYLGKESNLSLTSSLLLIDNNLIFTNGTIYLTISSSINVNGDVDLSHSTLFVDLKELQNNQDVELIHSNSSKSILLPNISILNTPQGFCTSVTYKASIQSIVLSSQDCADNSITLIASIIGGLLGCISIILITLLIIRRKSQYAKSFKKLEVPEF
eukprot:TRINITY_DN7719_c0_g3_i1.p1 TRINITY_DN7719_c0_g3~~TRINITY_DN7719_c0_g3_i1.p1  ORF type:complete len:219 (+),score=54.13 TRINITY_DN7719_c0_g3_i1:34-657(+)